MKNVVELDEIQNIYEYRHVLNMDAERVFFGGDSKAVAQINVG